MKPKIIRFTHVNYVNKIKLTNWLDNSNHTKFIHMQRVVIAHSLRSGIAPLMILRKDILKIFEIYTKISLCSLKR
jgi:septum formation topological specificity factor MinE